MFLFKILVKVSKRLANAFDMDLWFDKSKKKAQL